LTITKKKKEKKKDTIKTTSTGRTTTISCIPSNWACTSYRTCTC